MYVRTGQLSFIGIGLFFGALHLLGFVRLCTGQPYGDAICGLASSVMAILSIPGIGAANERLIPLEMGGLSMYGGVVFASKFSIWSPVSLSLFVILLAFCSDLSRHGWRE
jgi:hypothetical protein